MRMELVDHFPLQSTMSHHMLVLFRNARFGNNQSGNICELICQREKMVQTSLSHRSTIDSQRDT